MKKTKNVVVALMIASTAPLSAFYTDFMRDMHEHMARMQKSMDEMFDHFSSLDTNFMRTSSQQQDNPKNKLDVSLEKKDESLDIIIKNMVPEFEVTISETGDDIKVTSERGTLTLTLEPTHYQPKGSASGKGPWIASLTMKHEAKKEQKEHEFQQYYYTASSSYMSELVKRKPLLEKAEVKYDEKEQILTISIPFEDEVPTTRKKLEVNRIK